MYAVLRRDLQMTTGKAASQAGHAFIDSFRSAPPDAQRAYTDDGGTKVVLTVPDEQALCSLMRKLRVSGVPCEMVIEQDHVMLPHFDGTPVPTSIGVGPLRRSEARRLLRGLPLM